MEADASALDDAGWGHQFALMKLARANQPFASGSKVKAAVEEALTTALGPKPKDLKKQRKEKLKCKRKDIKKEKQVSPCCCQLRCWERYICFEHLAMLDLISMLDGSCRGSSSRARSRGGWISVGSRVSMRACSGSACKQQVTSMPAEHKL